ncbi:ester cyclase, partial [Amycolatopsis pretoriensis]
MTSDSDLALRYVDYLVGGDESILEEAFAPDFLDHVSGRSGTEMMRVVRGWLERSFADLTYDVHAVTTGDGV